MSWTGGPELSLRELFLGLCCFCEALQIGYLPSLLSEWASKELGEDEADDVNVWEDNWDDDAVEDDFSKQLR